MGDASALLTEHEHRVIALLGEAAALYGNHVCGGDVTRPADVAEFFGHVHDLQHAVMAQAAAREYPALYRLLGEVI